jgi:hypothetical protein
MSAKLRVSTGISDQASAGDRSGPSQVHGLGIGPPGEKVEVVRIMERALSQR